MKKFFLGILALTLSVMTVQAERVSQDDAALVANNFMNVAGTSNAKKAPAKKKVLKKAATAEENQYYVYENANGEGWVIVAANDVAHPILAYSETGHFRTDNQPANVKVWLNGYNRQITRAEQDGLVAPESIQQEWKTLRKGVSPRKGTPVVAPLIKTGWDQDAPYWNLCPQKSSNTCYTGCVATAMAQVMNYHQWPKKGTGSHTIKNTSYSANFGETTYDWDNMLDTYGNSATSAQKTAVATLMYHCGVAVDMQYGTASEGGSAAYTIDFNGYFSGKGKMCAETALTQFFGYKSSTVTGYYRDGDSETHMKSWTKSEWIAMLKEELDADRPIMYAGTGYEDPNDDDTAYGHSFICDGYDSNNLFHFNFGWTNWCDGYYDVDALETTDPGSGGGNGSYSLEQDVIVGIIPDRKDLPMITVTWSVDGNETTSQIMQTDPLVLPADPSDCTGEGGKKFVGWTAESEITDGQKPADLFTTAGSKTVTEPITYYAVFATAEEGGGEEITKASSIAVGDKVILVYETGNMELTSFSTTSTVYGIGSSYSGTPSGTYTFNVVAGSKPGSFAFENGGKYWNWSSGNSLSTSASVSDKSSWTVSFSGGDAYIVNVSDESRSIQWNTSSPRFACYTSSQAAVQLYKKAAGTSYSNYSLSCGATVVCELSSIELNTANVKKSFKQNEAFTYSGLVVTAHFNNCSDKTVAPTSVSAPDMSTAGNKTITVSYTKGETTKTATYDITVTELPTYTIRFFNNGTQVGADQHVTEGQEATPPADPTAACDDYTFVGWWTAELAADNKTAQSWVSDFTATKDQDYYAIYSKTETSGEASIADQLTRSTTGVSKGSTSYSNWSGKSVTSDAVYAGNSAGGNDAVQLRSKDNAGIITTASGGKITKVAVVWESHTQAGRTLDIYGKNSAYSETSDLYGSSRGTKLGSIVYGTSTELSISGNYAFVAVRSNDGALYLSSITFTWSSSTTTTYYSSVVTCAGTNIENTQVVDGEKAIKRIENGQIVIIRGNEKYTIFGQKIQ